MKDHDVTILTEKPTIIPLAAMAFDESGIDGFTEWTKQNLPECDVHDYPDLFGAYREGLSGNALLVELAGRKCYNSFGAKASPKTNAEYIAHTQGGDIPHASILYHAKMCFFFAGISRRVSLEMIRNYVGADRSFEGNPSQESTRYTHHDGKFVAHPAILGDKLEILEFKSAMRSAYDAYIAYLDRNDIANKRGLARKRVYEAAAQLLPQSAATSMIWTTNPVAIAKFIRERQHEASDLEIQRFARAWKKICLEKWPNLFPQSWMTDET